MSNGTIVVLAGTRPHAELIKNLKFRGYRTVLIDYTENPFAKEFADVHYMDSTLDVVAVERIAREEKACRIMDICIDRPIPIAAFVAEKLALPHPISYRSALLATDKNMMKKFMVDNEIPTSRFVPVASADELVNLNIKYPLIIKPSDASGSIGISRVENQVDLVNAVATALSKSRNGHAIVEEFVFGQEIQIDCFVENGEAKILDIKSKRMIRDDVFSLPFGSIIPAAISDSVARKVDLLCENLVNSLGIKYGPLYVQAIVSEQEVYVIEFGIRFGGGLSFKVINDVAGIDIVDATVEAYLGGTPHVQSEFSKFKDVYATFHMFPKAGIFAAVTGYEKLKAEGVLEYFAVNMKFGHECLGGLTSNERVAAFILRAETKDKLNEKLRFVLDNIDIVDVDGKSMMRKDIYKV